MKARVKATGEIVEVDQCSVLYDDGRRELMYGKELEEVQGAPDYWTRLEHQYAGMAMQSYVSNNVYLKEIRQMCKTPDEMRELVADLSILLATALVEKLKEKEEK